MNIIKEFLDLTKMKNAKDKSAVERAIDLPVSDGIGLKEYYPDEQQRDFFALRRTVRDFDDEKLSFEELSYLLWATQGQTGENDRGVLRTSPSAGATHALDTYLMVRNVDGLEKGLYKYYPLSHSIKAVISGDAIVDKITEACMGQNSVKKSAVTFIWVADIARSYWKFGPRAYRYAFIDSGHICDNLYLAARGVGCGVCAIGAYDDDGMDAILSLDGERRFTAYAAALGKMKNAL